MDGAGNIMASPAGTPVCPSWNLQRQPQNHEQEPTPGVYRMPYGSAADFTEAHQSATASLVQTQSPGVLTLNSGPLNVSNLNP